MSIFKIIRIPFLVIRDLALFVLMYLPGPTGIVLRRFYYSKAFKKCGKNLIIDIGVSITGVKFISVGDNVFIDKYCIISTGIELTGKIERKPNPDFTFDEGEIFLGNDIHIVQFCIIMGYGGVHIDNNCVISANCKLYSLTNTAYDMNGKSSIVSIMPYEQANFLLAPIVLKFNVWLGLNSVVMPGVTVHQSSFSVSNSILLNSFPENSYISGSPAKKIRKRFKINKNGHN